jgi:hypothetical protein
MVELPVEFFRDESSSCPDPREPLIATLYEAEGAPEPVETEKSFFPCQKCNPDSVVV